MTSRRFFLHPAAFFRRRRDRRRQASVGRASSTSNPAPRRGRRTSFVRSDASSQVSRTSYLRRPARRGRGLSAPITAPASAASRSVAGDDPARRGGVGGRRRAFACPTITRRCAGSTRGTRVETTPNAKLRVLDRSIHGDVVARAANALEYPGRRRRRQRRRGPAVRGRLQNPRGVHAQADAGAALSARAPHRASGPRGMGRAGEFIFFIFRTCMGN